MTSSIFYGSQPENTWTYKLLLATIYDILERDHVSYPCITPDKMNVYSHLDIPQSLTFHKEDKTITISKLNTNKALQDVILLDSP
jgi:hypothetical protein